MNRIVESIIVGQERAGEYDLRLLVLTPNGTERLSAIGILRPTAKLRGALQLFNHVELTTYGRKITGAHVIRDNTGVSRDINRFYLASSISDTLGRLMRDADECAEIFILANGTLASLSGTDTSCYKLFIHFYYNLLRMLGYSAGEREEDFKDLDHIELGLTRAKKMVSVLRLAYAENLEFKIPLAEHFA